MNDATVLRYKYIHIGRNRDTTTENGKPVWFIFNTRGGDAIGRIVWYPPWKRWVAAFSETSVWSSDCLANVQMAMCRLAQRSGLDERSDE